ncbi:hypothetical protein C7K65_29395 (plasmid) [Klebsiella pneumoniae subsp. pneumoniae]|nr:hypothetical protein C7K65_29395 [Klebsiella pneumoniae subsp. pneumoniae]
MLCHGTVCVVGKIRDLILQLSKSSIYSTKPAGFKKTPRQAARRYEYAKKIHYYYTAIKASKRTSSKDQKIAMN